MIKEGDGSCLNFNLLPFSTYLLRIELTSLSFACQVRYSLFFPSLISQSALTSNVSGPDCKEL